MGRVADFFREQNIPLAQQQRAKMVSLDRQVEELETKVQVLETENLHLKAEVNPLKQQVQRLEQKLQEKAAGSVVQHKPEPIEVDVMKFIGNQRSVNSSDIQKGMGIHSVPCELYLGKLVEAGLIGGNHVPMLGVMYSLTHNGNQYLVENKLVPVPGTPQQQPNNPKGHPCDHCGSSRLRRTGAVPDPHFGAVGVKAFKYVCLDCGGESAFTNDESSA